MIDIEKYKRALELQQYIMERGGYASVTLDGMLRFTEVRGKLCATKHIEPTREAVDAYLKSRGQ